MNLQQKNEPRNKFLRTLCCLNDILNPGLHRNLLIGKTTSILDKGCFNYEQLFHPIHCTARKICQWRSIHKLLLSNATGILSVFGQFHYLWGISFFANSTRLYWARLYQSWSLHILFFYHSILSNLAPRILLGFNSFHDLAIVAFQLYLMQIFREKFLEL